MSKEEILEWVEDMLISGIVSNRNDDEKIVEGRNFYIKRLEEMIIRCKSKIYLQHWYERNGITIMISQMEKK